MLARPPRQITYFCSGTPEATHKHLLLQHSCAHIPMSGQTTYLTGEMPAQSNKLTGLPKPLSHPGQCSAFSQPKLESLMVKVASGSIMDVFAKWCGRQVICVTARSVVHWSEPPVNHKPTSRNTTGTLQNPFDRL
jgi:hypothetical protein